MKSVVKKKEVALPKPFSKALELLSTTEMTLREVAKAVGVKYEEMCDIYAGRPEGDPVVQMFQSELKKVDTLLKNRLKRLTTENKLIVMEEINEILREQRKSGQKDDKLLIAVLNSLAKASAGVEVNAKIMNNTFTAMTPEELVHEYRRLAAIATRSKA